MRQIFLKSLLLLSPFLVLVIIFVVFDPMKIFLTYDNPTARGVQMNDRVYQVRYLDKKQYPYNAFLFGSSKSYAFHTSAWKKYIGNQMPYHMGCNDESIYGIAHKLNYLMKNGYAIQHALILLDERVLEQNTNPSAHIFREDPEVSGEPKLMFYRKFFTAFIQPRFIAAAIKYKEGITDSSVIRYMSVFHFSFNSKTGDRSFAEYDSMLAASPSKFYKRQQPLFPKRDTNALHTLQPLINETTLNLLKQVKETFDNQHTDYRIVIAPNYDQQQLNTSDLEQLKTIFGRETVFDFSGKNHFTSDIYNYYEHRHFKPSVADSLLELIYH